MMMTKMFPHVCLQEKTSILRILSQVIMKFTFALLTLLACIVAVSAHPYKVALACDN